MITNLIASIVVFYTTNVHEVFPAHPEFDPVASADADRTNNIPGGYRLWRMVPDENPQTKQVFTNIVQHTVYTFNVSIPPYTVLSNYSSTVTCYRLHTEWLLDTNIIHEQATNGIMYAAPGTY